MIKTKPNKKKTVHYRPVRRLVKTWRHECVRWLHGLRAAAVRPV